MGGGTGGGCIFDCEEAALERAADQAAAAPQGPAADQLANARRRPQVGEECDDGDKNSGDGCSDTCKVEPGFNCPVPGRHARNAGNGIKESAEACDDGNRDDGMAVRATACPSRPGGHAQCRPAV